MDILHTINVSAPDRRLALTSRELKHVHPHQLIELVIHMRKENVTAN